MKTYLVRNSATKGILGIFWAKTQLDLWWTIDEAGDPADYEYCVIRGPGGLFFERKEPLAAQWDDFDDHEEPPEFSWRRATESEIFAEVLHCQAEQRWKRMPYADQPGGGAHEAVESAKREKRGVYSDAGP